MMRRFNEWLSARFEQHCEVVSDPSESQYNAGDEAISLQSARHKWRRVGPRKP